MPTYTIKNRYTGHVIYSASADTRKAMLLAIPQGTNLTEAELSGEDLSNVQWNGVNLTRANFQDADLTNARLPGATLTDGNMTNANLTRASVRTATTTGLVTTGAKTRGSRGL